MADIESKMTRPQFIRNTLPTIRRVVTDAAPDAFHGQRSNNTLPVKGSEEPASSNPASPTFPPETKEGRGSIDLNRGQRNSIRPTDRLNRDHSGGTIQEMGDGGLLVLAPFNGTIRAWEMQIELVLKDFYNSIQKQRLPLQGVSDESSGQPSASSNNLSTGFLRRTPSTLSKAGSETMSYRSRPFDSRSAGPSSRWTAKGRRARLYPQSTTTTLGSSRTSLDDQSSVWSPSVASSTWSKYSSGKTLTSMSVDSLGSEFPQGDYQQSIGFANALSQAIIREEAAGSSPVDEPIRAAPLLEDETLELAGAPWAKEGILKHKSHLDAVDKKSKDRHWNECFAVVEKGWMRLFSFSMSAKSLRQKARNRQASGNVVGGGNWTENAEAIGSFMLRQTIASALPPPGYSKARPHVWALSLPTGAVHLFQVGTQEIVKEFVTTANYWSARLSKEPLVGGISNIEYGWSEAFLVGVADNNVPPVPAAGRPSLQSSIRSSIDGQSMRPRLPGDRVHLSDWNPPQQSMMASALMEVDQLKGLIAYVKNVEDELQKHNELRGPMLLAFSPRHPNHSKAMANWERKSSYLLREIVKFRTYIDCLHGAQAQKEKIYAERALAAPPAVSEDAGAGAPNEGITA